MTTPWIIVAACRHLDIDLRRFLAEDVAPATVPVLAELACWGGGCAWLEAEVTLAIGVPLGAAVVIVATLRWGLPARELAGLWRSLRGGPETGKAAGLPSGGVGVP